MRSPSYCNCNWKKCEATDFGAIFEENCYNSFHDGCMHDFCFGGRYQAEEVGEETGQTVKEKSWPKIFVVNHADDAVPEEVSSCYDHCEVAPRSVAKEMVRFEHLVFEETVDSQTKNYYCMKECNHAGVPLNLQFVIEPSIRSREPS